MGSIFLIGRDRNVWKNGQDLIALERRPQGNQFSLWLTDKVTPLYHLIIGRYHRVGLIQILQFQESKVDNAFTETRSRSLRVCTKYDSLLGFHRLPGSRISWNYYCLALTRLCDCGSIFHHHDGYEVRPCIRIHSYVCNLFMVHDRRKVD